MPWLRLPHQPQAPGPAQILLSLWSHLVPPGLLKPSSCRKRAQGSVRESRVQILAVPPYRPEPCPFCLFFHLQNGLSQLWGCWGAQEGMQAALAACGLQPHGRRTLVLIPSAEPVPLHWSPGPQQPARARAQTPLKKNPDSLSHIYKPMCLSREIESVCF